jgi:2-amino-4-hydroxy-6-hydroxymethyldihydropteridine diphosphokinase
MRAYIGLGANLGDPASQVRGAIARLAELRDSRLIAASSLYHTAPIGYLEQPDFVNAVVAVETALPAATLLGELRRIEASYRRERAFANAPRTLDLDLLLYGEDTIATPELEVPHPRMHERAFVLAPLAEISPEVRIPGRGLVAVLLAALSDQGVRRGDRA